MGKTKMRIVLTLLITTILLTAVPSSAISDIENHWAKESIQILIERNVISGYPDGTFKPNDNITRAEVFKIINDMFGYKEEGDIKFSDVKGSDWFYTEVKKGVKAGYIEEKGMLNPNVYVTREEVCSIIGITLGIEKMGSETKVFTDDDKIDKNIIGYVSVLKENGYISGYPDGSFGPKDNITRGEVSKIISSLSPQIDKKKLETSSAKEVTVTETKAPSKTTTPAKATTSTSTSTSTTSTSTSSGSGGNNSGNNGGSTGTDTPTTTPDYGGPNISYIQAFKDITVPHGTPKNKLDLPKYGDTYMSNRKYKRVNLKWANDDYNENIAGEYTFVGELEIPSGITNKKDVKAYIKVIVEKSEVEPPIVPKLTAMFNKSILDNFGRVSIKSIEGIEGATHFSVTFKYSDGIAEDIIGPVSIENETSEIFYNGNYPVNITVYGQDLTTVLYIFENINLQNINPQ